MGVDKRLQGREEWENWAFYVNNAPRPFFIEDLIDSKIPRPGENSPDYDNWDRQSRAPASWLVPQLGQKVVESYRNLTYIPRHADTAFEAIKTIIMGHGHTLRLEAWKPASRMSRSAYGSLEQFVSEYQQAVRRTNELGGFITYYIATLNLLDELDEDLPNWAANVEHMIPLDGKVTEADFSRLCGQAIEKGNALQRRRESSNVGIPSIKKSNGKKDRKEKGSDGKDNGWKRTHGRLLAPRRKPTFAAF
ncbi:hypothetical protein BJX96DRAFT_179759 [Aspergillus floccosus]